ncbi:Sugar kinase of the NBD/HSP70 family, may contain an N-terminal HTH domain [Geodermatophilus obscurus]|uniref:Sugar kinase of the NBD/HSP70 family, may contain an N-terminal HTH domain n=1 Tax=Geodermatophilus obscurus TaxID=1861 RepID=A0A1M7SS09_9ACTN|nr:ROK family protein [Geodermatophilus obscurus]SHN61184.1 Sugar kinase of the NBD/HSP70 family, may contain an N-terminal HTH domain [Geodermatophilus obscurus]
MRTSEGTGARQSTLRSSNLALVLRTVCAADAPLSRADVAVRTGTTRATAARLVDELVAGGLLDEGERLALPRRGRPATPLLPGARIGALGLQVDAGLLAARLLDLRGRVVAERVEEDDLVGSDPARTLARLGALATDLLAGPAGELRLAGAGLALPGLVDAEHDLLLRAPNLGWSDVDAVGLLAAHLPDALRPAPGNEADLAARTVAETAPGRPGPLRDFLYLSGQIGIGGAAVVGGRVMTGSAGWAGEVGHVCVDPDGPACRCGSTGCLEQYAGRHALLGAAGLPLDTTPAEVVDRAAAGDADVRRALDAAAHALGVALAGVVNVLDLPAVVLGGHLAALAGPLRPRLEELLGRRVLSARWRRPVVAAVTGPPAAGATGAALRALDDVLADPVRRLG